MKDYNKIFRDWLDLTEFELVKHGNRYGLRDLQGGNLGDIESERFTEARCILDGMDPYIEDYLVEPIYCCVCPDNEAYPDGDWDRFVDIARQYAREFDIHDSDYDIEMLDMICNHFEEVNIDEVYERWFK